MIIPESDIDWEEQGDFFVKTHAYAGSKPAQLELMRRIHLDPDSELGRQFLDKINEVSKQAEEEVEEY